MRADVRAAVTAAIEERLDECGILGRPTRQIVVNSSLEGEGEGVEKSTLLRALELVLDGVAMAFPAGDTGDPTHCPECRRVPILAQRNAEGTLLRYSCPDAHQWDVHLGPDQRLPGPNVPTKAEDVRAMSAVELAFHQLWAEGLIPEEIWQAVYDRGIQNVQANEARVDRMLLEIADESAPTVTD